MADDEVINAEVVSRLDNRYSKRDLSNAQPITSFVMKAPNGTLYTVDIRNNGNLRTTAV